MLHMQLKRRTNRAILSAMLLSLVLAAEAVPAQAAGRAELAMDGKAVPSGTVVALPEGSVAAFSLKLDGSLGTGYTSGNGAVAQTGTVQRFSDGEAVYAVKAIGQLGERAGLYIDGEKVLEIEIAAGAACPACQKTGCASVQVEYGAWHTDGERLQCLSMCSVWRRLPAANRDSAPVDLPRIARIIPKKAKKHTKKEPESILK